MLEAKEEKKEEKIAMLEAKVNDAESRVATPPEVVLTGHSTVCAAKQTRDGNVVGFVVPEVRVIVGGESFYPIPPKYDIADMDDLLAKLQDLQRRGQEYDIRGTPVGSIRIRPMNQ